MNRTEELKDMAGIRFNALAKIGRNEYVSMDSMAKICCALNCNIGDILNIIAERNHRTGRRRNIWILSSIKERIFSLGFGLI